MKKTILLLLAAIPVVLFTSSCNDSDKTAAEADQATPQKALRSFFDRLNSKDFEGAARFATKQSKGTLDMLKQKWSSIDSSGQGDTLRKDPTQRFKDVEIGEARIDGDNAYVPFKNREHDINIEFPLKKEDGEWKADFTLMTLLQIGLEEAKKRGIVDDSTSLLDIQRGMRPGSKLKDSLTRKIDSKKLEELQQKRLNQKQTPQQ